MIHDHIVKTYVPTEQEQIEYEEFLIELLSRVQTGHASCRAATKMILNRLYGHLGVQNDILVRKYDYEN